MLHEPRIETIVRPEVTDPSPPADCLSLGRVSATPPTAFYIPDIISPAEEQYLLSKVHSAPKPKWTTLRNRRLQQWGAAPSKGAKGTVAIGDQLPDWLSGVEERIAELGVWDEKGFEGKKGRRANCCLVNELSSRLGGCYLLESLRNHLTS